MNISNKDVRVDYVGELYSDKRNCIWYGGSVANIYYKDVKLVLAAIGDVRGDIYKDGEYLTSFKDKRNYGDFAHVINGYLPEIDSDEKLLKILNNELTEEEIKRNHLTAIMLDNNNWWEVLIFRDADCIDSYIVDSTDNLDEAMQKTIDNIEEIYSEYCS